MDLINTIAEEMRTVTLPPQVIDDYKVKLSGEFYRLSELLNIILTRKPVLWLTKRNDFTSDTQCERWWQATQDGIDEMLLRSRMKSVEKLLSALSSRLRLLEQEARNQI